MSSGGTSVVSRQAPKGYGKGFGMSELQWEFRGSCVRLRRRGSGCCWKCVLTAADQWAAVNGIVTWQHDGKVCLGLLQKVFPQISSPPPQLESQSEDGSFLCVSGYRKTSSGPKFCSRSGSSTRPRLTRCSSRSRSSRPTSSRRRPSSR